MKEVAPPVLETPLIGSGSPEEVENRVRHLLELGTDRGYLTYEELNYKLPDEVVSPEKLDSLLQMMDEMGIKLIDEADISEFEKKPRKATKSVKEMKSVVTATPLVLPDRIVPPIPLPAIADQGDEAEDDDEEIEVDLQKELAEAGNKRIDDPVRMYLTQMGEIPLLTREQEIHLAKKIEITRKIFRSRVLESD